MQAYSSFSPSTSTSTLQPQTIASTPTAANASLTIDPTALSGGGEASSSATTAPQPTASANAPSSTGASSSYTAFDAANSVATSSIAVKQEPDDDHVQSFPRLQGDDIQPQAVSNQTSTSATAHLQNNSQQPANLDDIKPSHSKAQTNDDPVSLLDKLLRSDHKAILRPDLSPFVDARDALRRLLPYHVWNIPHHDLLKALGLKEDPVLSEVRLRKRRRIAHRDSRLDASLSEQGSHSLGAHAEASSSSVKVDTAVDELQTKDAPTMGDIGTKLQHDDADLNELGLPVPLPEVPQPDFPTLDFTESIFSRRKALAKRFRRTLTALDTTHKRAPDTSLSLEQLERLAYNDDREDVLAQIEELKALKLKLEALEEGRQINVAESSAKLDLSFGITDEIEREREKERELERIKRQQERAAAKAAKLEKEREARHRLGIYTPPPEPPTSRSAAPAASPAPSAAATPAPTNLPSAGFLPMSGSFSGSSTPASTPGGYPFPPGVNLPFAPSGPNGYPMPSPLGAPSSYPATPGISYGYAPPLAPTPETMAPDVNGVSAPMGALTSAPSIPAAASTPAAPSTPAATPSKPPAKSKAKAAAAAAAAASVPGTPGTPGTPGLTPGPTPHRGRGRPRKHPLPGTPGGPPISVPRKKKEKPAKQAAATGSTPGTPSASGAAAMSPPTLPPGPSATQARPPPSPSPVPPTMPGPTPGYSGEAFTSTLPPTPTQVRPPAGSPPSNAASPMTVRPPTMHPTLTSATSLNTPRAVTPAKPSPSPSPAPTTAAPKKTPAKAHGATSKATTPAATSPAPAAPAAPASTNVNPSIPTHPIPLLIPVASLPRLSALGIQPTPSPHIRPVIGANGQPQGLEGHPVAIDPAQSVPAVLLGISEGTAEASADGAGGKQQILHISVVLSRLSPSQLSGLAVLMQSLQAQVEAGKRK